MIPNMAATMPTLGNIHHRGSHDVGTIKGLPPENIYVPRASWTEAAESPMKLGNRTDVWNANQFLKEEEMRQGGQEKRRQYLLSQYGNQWGELRKKTATMKDTGNSELAAMRADMVAYANKEKRKEEDSANNRKTFREGLDAQSLDLEHKRAAQMNQETKENAEMKLRNAQQLCEDMKEANRRKKLLEGQMAGNVNEEAAKAKAKKDDRNREIQLFRQDMREQLLHDEAKNLAQSGNMKIAQDRMQACADNWHRTAGKTDAQRHKAEANRQDIDEKRHEARMDLFYASREQARESQRQNMAQQLKSQVEFRQTQRQNENNNRSDDSAALMEAQRRFNEGEAQKIRDQKVRELEVQQSQRDMIAAKHKREQKEGHKQPHSTGTMRPARSASEEEFCKRVDASRHLDKPLGRPASWASPEFSKAAPKAVSLSGSSEKKKVMSLTAHIISRDHRMMAKWHEGLQPADLKAGRMAARKREAVAALAGKSRGGLPAAC